MFQVSSPSFSDPDFETVTLCLLGLSFSMSSAQRMYGYTQSPLQTHTNSTDSLHVTCSILSDYLPRNERMSLLEAPGNNGNIFVHITNCNIYKQLYLKKCLHTSRLDLRNLGLGHQQNHVRTFALPSSD